MRYSEADVLIINFENDNRFQNRLSFLKTIYRYRFQKRFIVFGNTTSNLNVWVKNKRIVVQNQYIVVRLGPLKHGHTSCLPSSWFDLLTLNLHTYSLTYCETCSTDYQPSAQLHSKSNRFGFESVSTGITTMLSLLLCSTYFAVIVPVPVRYMHVHVMFAMLSCTR